MVFFYLIDLIERTRLGMARTVEDGFAIGFVFSLSTVMNVGICMCFLLAALSSGSVTLPSHAMVSGETHGERG